MVWRRRWCKEHFYLTTKVTEIKTQRAAER